MKKFISILILLPILILGSSFKESKRNGDYQVFVENDTPQKMQLTIDIKNGTGTGAKTIFHFVYTVGAMDVALTPIFPGYDTFGVEITWTTPSPANTYIKYVDAKGQDIYMPCYYMGNTARGGVGSPIYTPGFLRLTIANQSFC